MIVVALPADQASASPVRRARNAVRSFKSRAAAPAVPLVRNNSEELVTLAQRGDRAAFDAIYRQYCARVYAVCLRISGNTAEAEDLTQDAFLQVLRKIHSFRGESAFSTWLHRIAVNLALMRLRHKSSRETSLEETTEQHGDAALTRSELVSNDREAAGSLDRLHVQRALGQLRPAQKLVVELHDIHGYKHTEIARIMHWTVGNSKSQLHRARTRLRKALQPKHHTQPRALAA